MSQAEPPQQQSWPDLDVSYFRWEPPVYPSVQVGDGGEAAKKEGPPRRIESAFAHSPFPNNFAGWDKLRATSEAGQRLEGLPGRRGEDQSGSVQTSLSLQMPRGQARFGSQASGPAHDAFPAGQNTVPGFPVPTSGYQLSNSRPPRPSQDSLSAFTALKGNRSLPVSGANRNFSWPEAPHEQHATFSAGMDAFEALRPPGSFGLSEAQGQGGAPLMVQCGSFTAPVQQEPQRPPAGLPGWASQQASRPGPPWNTQKAPSQLPPILTGNDPLQLQEYYTAQSDILEELMRGRGTQREPGYPGSAEMGSGTEVDPDFLDVLGPMYLGRATSVLEVPRMRPAASQDVEPYMPQWQSESVPAELPNHVVNRLMMGASIPSSSRTPRGASLSGTKRDWLGLQSGELPSSAGGPARQDSGEAPPSPKIAELEELAKNADMGVAHRAFLVPPHKKRGKGGRQPAADPRLDPNIDARRAKRILANRLSAARSKLRQKNQMDGLGNLVKQLEDHRKLLGEDAAELMEICEETEFENRRLLRQIEVLEEFGRRLSQQHSQLTYQRAHLAEDASSRPTSNTSQGEQPADHTVSDEAKSRPSNQPQALSAEAGGQHQGNLLLGRIPAELEKIDSIMDLGSL